MAVLKVGYFLSFLEEGGQGGLQLITFLQCSGSVGSPVSFWASRDPDLLVRGKDPSIIKQK